MNKIRTPVPIILVVILGLLLWPALTKTSGAKEQTLGVKEIARYEGKDREQKLLQWAKEKKEILVYASEQADDFAVMASAFEKKYGIKVNSYKGTGEALLQRIMTEDSAGKLTADIADVGGNQQYILKKEGFTIPFKSPLLAKYPKATYDKDGYWAGHRLTVFVPMYNTNAVPRNEMARTYKDFLNPKWKGKLAVEVSDYDWYATLMKHWGPAEGAKYFAQLKQQQLKPYEGHSLMTELLTSGEIQIAFPGYLMHALGEVYVRKAPVDWVKVDPVVVKPAGVSLLKSARNPAGGMLFIDFVLSEEGQAILVKRGRTPALPSIQTIPPDVLKQMNMVSVDFDTMYREGEKWLKEWHDLIGIQ